MKFNSKVLGILLVLFSVAIIISAASAADLVKNDFTRDNFGIEVPLGSDFKEGALTEFSFGDIAMNVVFYKNSGNNSDDINSIIYFKDTSNNKTLISEFVNDLENSGKKVGETDKYVILKVNKNSKDFDITNNFDNISSFIDSIFTSGGDIKLSADEKSLSASDKGFEVSDANGDNVSITSDEITVSGESSGGNGSFEDFDVNSNIESHDYAIYLKNSANDEVIVLSGNNLNLLKSMAETVNFKEN